MLYRDGMQRWVRGIIGTFVATIVIACGARGTDDLSLDGGVVEEAGNDGAANVTCNPISMSGKRLCVPSVGKAGEALTLEVEGEGCTGGCSQLDLKCHVEVVGIHIRLSLDGTECTTGQRECPAICGIPKTTCTLPKLGAGKYFLEIFSSSFDGGVDAKELVVDPTGTVTACILPPH